MIFWLMTVGCGANLDFMIHNGKHCSIIDEVLCNEEPYWDKLCVTCEEEYPWDQEYEWMEATISNGESIRAIDINTIVDLDFETEDGVSTLDAYFIPAHGENAALADTTLIYSHGNRGGIEHYLPRIRMLHEWGVNILAWDYRGYGKSSSSEPSIAGVDCTRAGGQKDTGFRPNPAQVAGTARKHAMPSLLSRAVRRRTGGETKSTAEVERKRMTRPK